MSVAFYAGDLAAFRALMSVTPGEVVDTALDAGFVEIARWNPQVFARLSAVSPGLGIIELLLAKRHAFITRREIDAQLPALRRCRTELTAAPAPVRHGENGQLRLLGDLAAHRDSVMTEERLAQFLARLIRLEGVLPEDTLTNLATDANARCTSPHVFARWQRDRDEARARAVPQQHLPFIDELLTAFDRLGTRDLLVTR